jgi:hypothetical protein
MGGGVAMFSVQLLSVTSVCLKLLPFFIRQIAYGSYQICSLSGALLGQRGLRCGGGIKRQKKQQLQGNVEEIYGPRWSSECNYLRQKPVM